MSGRKFVLSLDGGGIRGIVPGVVLGAIEHRTGRRIAQLFDLIAGTSTGGILALGCAVPGDDGDTPRYAADDLLELYTDHGGQLFTRHLLDRVESIEGVIRPKYAAGPIEALLKEYFGDAMMSHGLTELAVTSYDVFASRPFFFKRRYPLQNAVWDCEMWKAARATSAAPTYFPALHLDPFPTRPPDPPDTQHELVDGGVYVNDPAVCAYVEALELWPDMTDVVVCSIGTGNKRMRARTDLHDAGIAGWAPAILDTVFDGVADAVDYQMVRICRHDDGLQRYFRLQADIPDRMSAAMDDATPAHLAALTQLGRSLVEHESAQIDALCALLGERAAAPAHPAYASLPTIAHPASPRAAPVG
jgi:patatin-like phospholipase/acyl hydrolase